MTVLPQVREHPIPFNGPMVRAVIAGIKTQTRRPPNAQNAKWKVGDRLWVRETWARVEPCPTLGDDYGLPLTERLAADPALVDYWRKRIVFRADFSGMQPGDCGKGASDNRWRPSIHMPKWASRITLEITNRREENIHDITEEDAHAEGITDGGCLNCGEHEPCGCDDPRPDYRDSFVYLWDSIYGQTKWAWVNNPVVPVFQFRLVEVRA